MTKVIGKLSYDPKNKIGQGAFSTVYSGLYSQSTPVAIKRISIDLNNKSTIQSEVDLMIKAKDHPNILRYISKETNDEFMFIATELCRGTLEDYVKGNYDGPTFESEREILWQITQGLAHLHGLDIVHRDIKPTNILIYVPSSSQQRTEAESNPQAKLADFGRCKVIDGDFTNTSVTNPNGTRGWIAPELYQDQRAGPKVDIFALGLIFGFTLSEGKHPFGDDPDERVMRIKKEEPMLIVRNDLMEPYSSDEDDKTYNLIKSMLVMNPEKRPTVEHIVKSPFFLVGMIPDERPSFEEITNNFFSFQANRQKIFESVHYSFHRIFPDSIVHFKKLLIYDDPIDVNVQFESGYTLLHILCGSYEDDNLIYLVQLLVNKGADVKAKSRYGTTPLHCLCYNYENDNLIDIVQLLVKKGADVKAKDTSGWTPLHVLCSSNEYAINGGDNWKRLVNLFEKRGANMEANDNFGKTPNDYLIERKK